MTTEIFDKQTGEVTEYETFDEALCVFDYVNSHKYAQVRFITGVDFPLHDNLGKYIGYANEEGLYTVPDVKIRGSHPTVRG